MYIRTIKAYTRNLVIAARRNIKVISERLNHGLITILDSQKFYKFNKPGELRQIQGLPTVKCLFLAILRKINFFKSQATVSSDIISLEIVIRYLKDMGFTSPEKCIASICNKPSAMQLHITYPSIACIVFTIRLI